MRPLDNGIVQSTISMQRMLKLGACPQEFFKTFALTEDLIVILLLLYYADHDYLASHMIFSYHICQYITAKHLRGKIL